MAYCTLLILLMGHILVGTCQANYDHRTVFSIPKVYVPFISAPPHVLITTSSSDPVDATITIPGNGSANVFQTTVVVSRYQQADITLPESIRIEKGDGIQTGKTIIAQASNDISVHGIDNEYANHDGFRALTTSQLGTDYYVASFTPDAGYGLSYPSFFVVTAIEDQTQVDITTASGEERSVVLDASQSFRYDGNNKEDLTGSRVQSTKPVAVISGVFTKVPAGIDMKDTLLDQLLPVKSLGRNYVLFPFLGRSSGYIYRVVAPETSATLQISEIGSVNTDGAFYEGDVSGDQVVSITSDIPIMVIQYMKSHFTDNNGDPSMIVVPPIDLGSNDVSFPVFTPKSPSKKSTYINVIVECTYVSGLIFDDTLSMQGWNTLTSDDGSICSVRGSVDEGQVHNVKNSNQLAKMSVIVYAVHEESGSSYAYTAGMQSLPDANALPAQSTSGEPSVTQPGVKTTHLATPEATTSKLQETSAGEFITKATALPAQSTSGEPSVTQPGVKTANLATPEATTSKLQETSSDNALSARSTSGEPSVTHPGAKTTNLATPEATKSKLQETSSGTDEASPDGPTDAMFMIIVVAASIGLVGLLVMVIMIIAIVMWVKSRTPGLVNETKAPTTISSYVTPTRSNYHDYDVPNEPERVPHELGCRGNVIYKTSPTHSDYYETSFHNAGYK